MADKTFPITIQAGDDNDLVVTWRPDGEVVDLTGATAEMTIEWSAWRTGAAVVAAGSVEYTTASEITIDEAEGIVTVAMGAASTAAIPPSAAWYQLRVTESDGRKSTIASGDVTILRNFLDD